MAIVTITRPTTVRDTAQTASATQTDRLPSPTTRARP
jgi:hypothetical protein